LSSIGKENCYYLKSAMFYLIIFSKNRKILIKKNYMGAEEKRKDRQENFQRNFL
jgi:hypothetical protein